MHANSVQCTVCKNSIHNRCSDVCGDLLRVSDGFRCRQCDGTIQEADLSVKSFCYLGDTLDGDGGADFAATARIRNRDEKSSVCQLHQKQHDLWK